MKLTPAIKGQLTKAAKPDIIVAPSVDPSWDLQVIARRRYERICAVFSKYMPRQQAKHATRKFLKAA